jgi:predicted PurR-regulated permease PerM
MNNHKIPSWVLRLVIGIFISSILLVFSIYILWKLSSIVSIVIIALFLSFALEPFVNYLVNKGWKRNIASLIVIMLFASLAIILILGMVPLVIDQLGSISDRLPQWSSQINTYFNSWFGLNIDIEGIYSNLNQSNALSAVGLNIANNVIAISKQLIFAFIQIFAVIILTYYFVSDAPRLRRLICSFLPAKQQKFLLNTWELAITKTGNFMYSRGLLGLVSAVFTLIVLLILGVPFALPLALWMGVVSQFLPVIGTFIAASLPLMVAFINSPRDALILLILIIIYQQFENYIIGPKITSHTMEMHPAVALLAVLIGATVAGVVGALIALPVAAILQEITKAYIKRHELIESKLLKHPLKNKSKKTS